jgi:hypothetical protein
MPPLRLAFRHAGYLVALVLADIQIAWITFNRGRYQQTSRTVSQFGSLRRPPSARSAVYGLTAYRLIQKARGGFFGAGFILATMKIGQ